MPKTRSDTYGQEYGWPAVPRNRSNIPSAPSAKDVDTRNVSAEDRPSAKTTSVEVSFKEIWPKTDVVQKAQDYVKGVLPQETYNHSLRVYCYGEFHTRS